MLTASALLVIGLIILILSGDRFVVGASAFAKNCGVTPMMVGLTIVALGTSAPELFVSAIAAWQGSPGIAVGNAIGSNIANIGLVIGLTALILPIEIHSQTLKREFPLLLIVMAFALLVLWDGYLGRVEAALLLIAMFVLISWFIYIGARAPKSEPMNAEYQEVLANTLSTRMTIFFIAIGLIGLPLGSELFVEGAVKIARHIGVSDEVIGLTVVAIGTSLPEVMASVMGAIKNEPDIAVGNIIGSNMFNLLGVLGVPGLIHPFHIAQHVLTQDYLVMTLFSIALVLMAFGFKNGGRVNRIEGGILLVAYMGYLAWIAVNAMV